MLTKNNSKKIKHITDEKVNLYYSCDDSSFKNLKQINEMIEIINKQYFKIVHLLWTA